MQIIAWVERPRRGRGGMSDDEFSAFLDAVEAAVAAAWPSARISVHGAPAGRVEVVPDGDDPQAAAAEVTEVVAWVREGWLRRSFWELAS